MSRNEKRWAEARRLALQDTNAIAALVKQTYGIVFGNAGPIHELLAESYYDALTAQAKELEKRILLLESEGASLCVSAMLQGGLMGRVMTIGGALESDKPLLSALGRFQAILNAEIK